MDNLICGNLGSQSVGCENTLTQYTCKNCDFMTDLWIRLHDHIWMYHVSRDYVKTYYKVNTYTCNNCDFTSYSLLVRLAHEQAHVELGYDKITSCYTHSGGAGVKWFKCGQCEYKAHNRSTLSCHNKAKHRPEHVIQCKYCSYRTAFQNHLKRHIIAFHTDPEEISWFKCEQCEFKTKQKSNLKIHIGRMHLTKEVKWFTCEQCEYKTNQKDVLNIHIKRKHHPENLLQCNQCSYRTAYSHGLKTHIISRHTDSEEISWFECYRCEYKAKRKTNLKRHVLFLHTDPEEISWFKCHQCEYKAKRKYILKRHIDRRHRTESVLHS